MGRFFGTVYPYKPREWKGQVSKEVTKNRLKAKLTVNEQANIVLPKEYWEQHNVWDAVGVGLKHLEKTKRREIVTVKF